MPATPRWWRPCLDMAALGVRVEEDNKKQDKAQAGTDDKAVTPAEDVPVAATKPEVKAPSKKPAAPAQRGSGPAWLALLLALAATGLAGWMYYQQQFEDKALEQRLAGLEDKSAGGARELQRLGNDVQGAMQGLQSGLQAALQQQQASLDEQRAQLESLQTSLGNQRQQLLKLSSVDRSDWSLAEAEYLLRLAYQRLLMAGDLSSAAALLSSADSILKELDDPALHPVRAAIAADLAALRAVPSVDIEGTWLRLGALAGEVDRLLLFELPDAAAASPEPTADASWRERLQHGFSAAVARLSSYVVIRRREAPYQALLDPQWERLVRQNLRMLLEQSRSALLSGNEVLYRQSLSDCRRWLGEFFSFNEASVSAMDKELQALGEISVARTYPDISGSLAAVKEAADARRATREGR